MSLLTDDEIDELQKAWIANGMSGSRSFAKAITAIKQAQAQQAQEPVAWRCNIKGYQAQNDFAAFTPGLPDKESIEYIHEQGGVIEYVYAHPAPKQSK
jgi:hypothetical protein